ncbi:unnamed protein product, partial [Linum tenue]
DPELKRSRKIWDKDGDINTVRSSCWDKKVLAIVMMWRSWRHYSCLRPSSVGLGRVAGSFSRPLTSQRRFLK